MFGGLASAATAVYALPGFIFVAILICRLLLPARGQSLPWRHLLRRSCNCQRVGHLRDSRAHPGTHYAGATAPGLRADRDRLCSYH